MDTGGFFAIVMWLCGAAEVVVKTGAISGRVGHTRDGVVIPCQAACLDGGLKTGEVFNIPFFDTLRVAGCVAASLPHLKGI